MARSLTANTPGRVGTHAGRRRGARLALTLPFVVPLLLLLALAGTAYAAPAGAAQALMPLSVCQANPGKCIAVNPGYGSTGTSITVTGNTLPPGHIIIIGYSSGDCSAGITKITSATATVDGSGNVTITFQWPSTSVGHYAICAIDTTSGTTLEAPGGFTVHAPAITLNSPVFASQTVTVSGKDFEPTSTAGAQVEVLYGAAGSNGCTTSVGMATVGSDGTFSTTFSAPFESADTQLVVAAVQPEHACSSPNLKATANLTVLRTRNPTISVSGTINSGQNAQVKGTDFLPASVAGNGIVQILYGAQGSDGCTTALGTATVNSDGTFTTTVKMPTESNKTVIVLTGIEPQGSCTAALLKAQTTVTINPLSSPAPPPLGPAAVVFCLVGLLLLLLLVLLLLLLMRRRNKQQPATIQEQDNVVVNADQGGGGQAQVQRQIYAQDPRTGQRTPIAQEVYTSQDDLVDDPNDSGGGY